LLFLIRQGVLSTFVSLDVLKTLVILINEMKVFVGTSGWAYSSFKGWLYPENSKSRDWLKIYSEKFNTVEVNVTFYRRPRKSTFEKWYNETPSDFVFSLKAPRVITHLKRLKGVEEELKTFLQDIKPLKEKAKVLLFQLPPSFKYDREVLEKFFSKLPSNYLRVLEIRHASFHNEEFVDLLRKYQICLCFSDCGKRYPSWFEVKTTDYLYIRMHGREQLYVSNYTQSELEELAEKVKSYKPAEVYVYFDNTAKGYAVPNALSFKSLLS